MTVPGGGPYIEFLMPGMFVMTMAFGTGETMIAVTQDAERGVTNRFRSMPMSSAAVLLGGGISDMLYAALGLAVMVACGLVLGWRWHTGPTEVAAASACCSCSASRCCGRACSWASRRRGGRPGDRPDRAVPGDDGHQHVRPTETMPPGSADSPSCNPLSATVTATRELFGNPGVGGELSVATHAVELAVLWPLAIIAVFLPLSVRRYRRLDR